MKRGTHKQRLGSTTVTVTVLHKRDLLSESQQPLDTVLKAIEENPELILLENSARPHVFEVDLPDSEATRK